MDYIVIKGPGNRFPLIGIFYSDETATVPSLRSRTLPLQGAQRETPNGARTSSSFLSHVAFYMRKYEMRPPGGTFNCRCSDRLHFISQPVRDEGDEPHCARCSFCCLVRQIGSFCALFLCSLFTWGKASCSSPHCPDPEAPVNSEPPLSCCSPPACSSLSESVSHVESHSSTVLGSLYLRAPIRFPIYTSAKRFCPPPPPPPPPPRSNCLPRLYITPAVTILRFINKPRASFLLDRTQDLPSDVNTSPSECNGGAHQHHHRAASEDHYIRSRPAL